MIKEQLRLYKEFARSYYGGKDRAHDFRHIERILSRLELLSEGLSPPRRHLLYFLACFHGLRQCVRDDQQFREKVGNFLHGLGWSDEEVEEAFRSLERHLKAPQTVEEKPVHDANFVELLGAFGIAKAFTEGGALRQSYEQTADIFKHQYLDKVKFRTPVGRRWAKERRAYTKEFLRRLQNER